MSEGPLAAAGKAVIRTALSTNPFLAPIAQLWNEYESYRSITRIEELISQLASMLDAVRSRFVRLEDRVSQVPDFPELLEIAAEKVRREHDARKREAFAHLLVQFLVSDERTSHDSRITLLEALDSLNETDFRALRALPRTTEFIVREVAWRELGYDGDETTQVWQFASNLSRLEGKGLIVVVTAPVGATYHEGTLDNDAARWLNLKCRVLPLGKTLCNLLFA